MHKGENFIVFSFFYLKLCSLLYFFAYPIFAQTNLTTCGTKDEDLPSKILEQMRMLPQIIENQLARKANGEIWVCRIMIDIDSETYLRYEGDTAEIIQRVFENIET